MRVPSALRRRPIGRTAEGDDLLVLEQDIRTRLQDTRRNLAVANARFEARQNQDRLLSLLRRASAYTAAPAAVMTTVSDTDQQWLAAVDSAGNPMQVDRSMSLTESYCKYVVATDAPFAVNDADTDPVVSGAFHHFEGTDSETPRAYLGVPLRDESGQTLGALCVYEDRPRHWRASEREMLASLSAEARL